MGNEYLKAGETFSKTKSTTTKANSAKVQRKCACSQQDSILQMQQTVGNQALVQMLRAKAIQAKLTVGAANDTYEQEADQVADQVMRMPDPEIQRGPKEEEEEKLRTSPLPGSALAGTISPLIQREPPLEDEEKKLQGKFFAPGQGVLQKKDPDEDEELQAKAASDAMPELDAGVESGINNLRGGGQPLPESVRNYFEPRFGYDFGQVRVHHNSQAAESAQAVNAKAFTLGNDMVFNSGQYAPDHSDGKKLIAHELTHVIQQNGK